MSERTVCDFQRGAGWRARKSLNSGKKLFQSPKLFQTYFSDIEHVGVYSLAAVSYWDDFEIISRKFPRAEIQILFQSDVDEG